MDKFLLAGALGRDSSSDSTCLIHPDRLTSTSETGSPAPERLQVDTMCGEMRHNPSGKVSLSAVPLYWGPKCHRAVFYRTIHGKSSSKLRATTVKLYRCANFQLAFTFYLLYSIADDTIFGTMDETQRHGCTFPIPVLDNRKKPVDQFLFQTALLRQGFRGWTIAGSREGTWEGQTGDSIWYVVAVPPERVDELKSVVRTFLRAIGEEKMYFDRGSPTVDLLDLGWTA